MAKIIISYRRSDAASIAGRIAEKLEKRFGRGTVFIDVDKIPFGIDFRDYINQELESSDVLLAVIGPRWLGENEDGHARIKDPHDPVRIEVETAIRRNITVIPVLVEGASIPKAGQLPESLEPLCYRHAAEVDSGRDYHPHTDRLIQSIERVIWKKTPPATHASFASPRFLGLATGLALLGLAVFFVSRHSSGGDDAGSDRGGGSRVDLTRPGPSQQTSTTPHSAPTDPPAPSPPEPAPPEPAPPEPDPPGRFRKQACGAIRDTDGAREWFVGPDRNFGWSEAARWTRDLSACGGSWSMPTASQVQSLFDPALSAGVGFYTGGRHFPAHIDAVFSQIGDGSWVWTKGNMRGASAPAFNLNQGQPVMIPSDGGSFTVRAFAVRALR